MSKYGGSKKTTSLLQHNELRLNPQAEAPAWLPATVGGGGDPLPRPSGLFQPGSDGLRVLGGRTPVDVTGPSSLLCGRTAPYHLLPSQKKQKPPCPLTPVLLHHNCVHPLACSLLFLQPTTGTR